MNPSYLGIVKPLLAPRFGPLVAHVANILGQRGSVNLASLAQQCKLPLRVLKECLVVLIHHRLVNWRNPGDGNDAAATYSLNLANVLHSGLIPWLLDFVQKETGDNMKSFAEGVISGTFQDPPAVFLALGVLEEKYLLSSFPDATESRKKARTEGPKLYTLSLPAVLQLYRREVLAQTCSRLMKDARFVPLVRSLCDSKVLSLMDMGKCVPGLSGMEAKNLLDSLYWKVDWIERSSIPHLTFTCNLPKAKRFLAQGLTSCFVSYKWSGPSLRLLNILRAKGFLQDKTISAAALMPIKEVRERMYLMFTHGIVHMQEVPRTVDHAPNKTSYLWALDEAHRSWPAMALKAAASLTRQLEFIHGRKEASLLLLDKLSREDITEEMLSAAEKTSLDQYRFDQAVNYAQFLRLLTDLLILRHF